MSKTEKKTKSNGEAKMAPQKAATPQMNLLRLTDDQALSILDEVTNTGLNKHEATYAVFAINKLKATIQEVKELREKVKELSPKAEDGET